MRCIDLCDDEKVVEYGVTREFYYLDGNVIVVKKDGVFTPYLAFTDNLGSILSLMDENGDAVFEAEYDAWGKPTVSLNEIGFHRGYTGHEMLPEFDLINMNGRLYDPMIGLFLSPDNYVQAPDDSQNFNRYSYCLNNPLKYTDPSGEFWHIIVGAIIGGVVNWATNGHEFSWKGFGYFNIGALAGGASAALGGGMSSALAGGSFWAGAGGTSAAMSVSSSFASGAIIGSVTGAASGTIIESGNAWMKGASFGQGLLSGFIGGNIGGFVGGLVGGTIGGIEAVRNHGNFWTGRGITVDNIEAIQALTCPEVGEDMRYDTNFAIEFSNENFGDINEVYKRVDHLYADGSIPQIEGYTLGSDGYVYHGDKKISGTCIYNGFGRGSDVYLYKSAFACREKLYLVMGHEYLHACYNSCGLMNVDAQHAGIADWEYTQSRNWKYQQRAYWNRYKSTKPFYRSLYKYKQFVYRNMQPIFAPLSVKPW